jgi:hypothetical protein
MELFRCPFCHHSRCFECHDRPAPWLTCCKCGRKALPVNWFQGHRKRGRPCDVSPRLGTGRPTDASKLVAQKLTVFLDRHGIPLRSFGRLTRISPWAIRMAKAGKRSLSQIQENLIERTTEKLEGGQLWLRQTNRQKWDLVWLAPPGYKPHCPTTALYCRGGVLPGTCPKRWKECPLNAQNWGNLEKAHEAYLQYQATIKQRQLK